MMFIKAHLGCNDTRCIRTRVELPRASASPDWWKPRCGETDIKSTNLPGSRSTIRFERGRMSRGGAISRCPPSRAANRRASVHRSQLVTRRANKHRIALVVVVVLLEGNWCARLWKGWKRDNALCNDAHCEFWFVSVIQRSGRKWKYSIKATFPNYINV